MEPWVNDFIEGLKNGKPEAYLARVVAGLPLAVVQAKRDAEPEFAALWDHAIGVFEDTQRTLNARTLKSVLKAQVPDEHAAAYFEMDIAEFKSKVNADPALKKVYDTARAAGKAELKIAQWDNAAQGNWQAQQWLGKNDLGQSDSASSAAPAVSVTFNVADPGASYRQLLAGGSLELPAIDAGVQDVVLAEKEKE